MAVLHVWPLGFLLLVPGLIILYLLKVRARKYTVSSVSFFRELYHNMEATKPWERFVNQLLFYIQLFLILLWIFALVSPYLKHGGQKSGQVILCIDNSGSMNALYDDKKTKLEEAKKKAEEYIEGLAPNQEITLILANKSPQILVSATSDRQRIKKALSDIEGTDVEGNMSGNVTFLQSVTDQMKGFRILMFTDRDVDLGKLQATVVDMSPVTDKAKKNLSVDYVSHTNREDGSVDVLANVSNHGLKEVEGELNCYLGETLLQVMAFTLKAGENESLYLDTIKASGLTKKQKDGDILRIELAGEDALAGDNVAYDFLDDSLKKKVLLVSKSNIFLEKAICADENITLYRTNSVKHLDTAMEYDLYIFDGVMPEQLPKKGNILLWNPDKEISIDGRKLFTIGNTKKNVWVKSTEHEVTRYLEDFIFGVSKLRKIQKPEWASEFFEAASYSAGFMGEISGRNIAVLAFDIHNTDFPLQAEFPIFINNLMGKCMDTALLPKRVLTAGEPLQIHTVEEGKIEVMDEENNKTEVDSETMEYTDTQRHGLYKLIWEGRDEIQSSFAISLPVSESKILGKITVTGEKGTEDGKKADEMEKGVSLQLPILLMLLLTLLAEWTLYCRRF